MYSSFIFFLYLRTWISFPYLLSFFSLNFLRVKSLGELYICMYIYNIRKDGQENGRIRFYSIERALMQLLFSSLLIDLSFALDLFSPRLLNLIFSLYFNLCFSSPNPCSCLFAGTTKPYSCIKDLLLHRGLLQFNILKSHAMFYFTLFFFFF